MSQSKNPPYAYATQMGQDGEVSVVWPSCSVETASFSRVLKQQPVVFWSPLFHGQLAESSAVLGSRIQGIFRADVSRESSIKVWIPMGPFGYHGIIQKPMVLEILGGLALLAFWKRCLHMFAEESAVVLVGFCSLLAPCDVLLPEPWETQCRSVDPCTEFLAWPLSTLWNN